MWIIFFILSTAKGEALCTYVRMRIGGGKQKECVYADLKFVPK